MEWDESYILHVQFHQHAYVNIRHFGNGLRMLQQGE
jgi:hypothetical protein